ncbi:hypothetical protein GCM10017044_15310 [Kordiimonas sediminis]|uniref:HTH tetR-type domain-containing protein n=1 Tax=Kordiimonas sediminis TaxID=1735581 RepID=A0A919ATK8_9PROT|nr:TetR/AcrR family transcriptional regulator [Kordiimonas sediminis]GHF22136.1 hypothetical protein GCM10017044_15310 [Kordiimonas sediminis]
MGRRSILDEAGLFAAVGETLAMDGSLSIPALVKKTGVSTGSIYHHYGSREGLLAHAWVDALSAFQRLFLATIGDAETVDSEAVALVTPKFCREHHGRAIILACCSRAQFIGHETNQSLLVECDARNEEMAALLRKYSRSSGVPIDNCYLAWVHYPLAVVRLYLPAHKVPKSADAHVVAACHAAMAVNQKEDQTDRN